MNLKLRSFLRLILILAAITAVITTGCNLPQPGAENQKIEKNGSSILPANRDPGDYYGNLRCRWDNLYLQVRYVPDNGYCLTFGPMTGDDYNSISDLQNQWEFIPTNIGWFIKCRDPRLTDYAYYLAGSYSTQWGDDENDEDIWANGFATLRRIKKSSEYLIYQSILPPSTSIMPSYGFSNEMLIWNLNYTGTENYYRFKLANNYFGDVGVLNIQNRLNWPEGVYGSDYNDPVKTRVQIGYNYNGDTWWTSYWSNQWAIEWGML